ncbi:Methyl-CpG-binding domain-containing protein 9 [Cymbomonas tetramitiformis]|uniref:Methyl-CpG-binding domain-containing protein 9 n=1 Tax=Cymbomonas tetramitiformis TaxID=36881 RepID=A0AAE0F6K2_9CHLO|nr:Methyl-CpG-binding domain-containing protein 9 [Cymbomonas tetramitiformis]
MQGEGSPAVYYDEEMEDGVLKKPKRIDTRVVAKSFFREAREEGVTCYEPCGGLCAGLEMLLRSGVKVNQYLYQDISPAARAVARARCFALSRRYSELFPASAIKLEQLPADLEQITAQHFVDAGALAGERWIMVCGYPCQDVSPAGNQAGLDGRHSRLFYHAVRALSALQQLQPHRPPGYILENVSPLAHRPGTRMREEVFPHIMEFVGQPVSFDAAQAGSYAHRLRAFWSNLFQNNQFDSVMARVERPQRYVTNILEDGWQPREVVTTDEAPFHVANVKGEPMRALPTIMATQNSFAFREPRMGSLVRSVESKELPKCREPNLDEKAHAMGYSVTELRSADRLDDGKLARVLGLAMDRRAVELLYAVAEASRLGLPYSKEQHQAEETCDSPAWEPEEGDWVSAGGTAQQPEQASAAEWVSGSNRYTQHVAKSELQVGREHVDAKLQEMHKRAHTGTHGLGAKFQQRKKRWEMQPFSAAQYRGRSATGFRKAAPTTQTGPLVTEVPSWRPPVQEKPMRLPALKDTTRLVELIASVAQQQEQREDFKDIHDDEWCLRWLKSRGTVEPPAEMANRVKKRAARHRWDEATDEIYLITYAGKKLRVPKPADRLELVRTYHDRTGHWGIRRTLNLLWQRNWWVNMKKDVVAVVTQCKTCSRVKTHYAREAAVLTPLEIKSFMYRWSLDLARPTRDPTKSGNTRVLIMTEHYTRFIICVPIPNKEAVTIANAFRNHVLSVFGAPAECLVDGGTEFEGEFKELCRACLIDRRVTSPNSPEGNGLTERVVRTIKYCLKKIALDQGLDVAWDKLLWSLVLSYNAAVQESLKVAPFTLLFAQEATVPPALKSRPPLDFDVKEVKNEYDTRVRDLVARAKVVKELMVTAGCNLEVAQHRDTLLYEGRRGGGQVPKPHNFQVGDFVYIRQRPRTGIEVATKPAILKLVKMQRDGVVVLEDSARTREKSTVQNIAPCHLQVKDEYDLTRSKPSKHLACEYCKRMDGEAFMLLCDTCNKGYHTWCLEPALDGVPEGDWQCPSCLQQEVTASFVEVKSELSEKLLQAEGKLKEALGKGMRLLEFDVGPKRALRGGAVKPWQALSKEAIGKSEGSMGDWPDRIDWGNQEVLTEMVQRLMPGQWHEGHRTILSRKCVEQQGKARMLKGADLVPAMQQDEVEKRGDVAKMTRVQVKNASMLHWGLELVMTVPKEVDRLAKEVNWSRVTRVWDPWAGTGVIGSVLKGHWDHLSIMNNDWNPQLKWPEAMNALQPGNYRRWKEKYGVCDAVVTSPWFAVLDIALPLAVAASRVVACVHVPSHYMTDMTESRARYFRELCHAGRLHVLGHLEHGPIGRRCMWVLVFKNPLLRARMLRTGELSGVGMFIFSVGKFAPDGITSEDVT